MRCRLLAVTLILILAALFAPTMPERGTTLAAAGEGRLLLPRSGGLAVLDLAAGSESLVYPTQEPVLGAAWSPDGARVVFAQWGRQPDDRFGSSGLYLLEGGQAVSAVVRGGPDQMVTDPAWTADGQGLVYQVSGVTAGGFSVEQASLDGSGRRKLEDNAASPTLSADGGLLAFVRFGGSSDVLAVRPLAGGAAREVVASDAFIALSSPRFSPDGRRIAFLAIGGPIDPIPTPRLNPLSWLRPGASTARAHGIPWDPWVVNLDGSGLRQVAMLASDDPAIAWAPDGSALAVLGGEGLWLVPLDGSAEPTLVSHGSYGVLDWRP